MRRLLVSALAVLTLATASQAHFVFVVPEAGGAKAKLVFSDNLEPDETVDVTKIGGTKLFLRGAADKASSLSLEKKEHAYQVALLGSGPRLVYGSTEYGVSQRGDAKPFLLRYHPKAIVGWLTADAATLGASATLEIVPVGEPGQLRFLVLAQGKPVVDAEVNLLLPDGKKQKATTDKTGLTATFAQTGRFGLWARHTKTENGESGGKKYEEVRDYATLVLDVVKSGATAPAYPPLPQAVSSFGAAVADGWLYVYGGHSGKAHQYSTETVSGAFRRLKLSDPKAWEELPGGPALQGLALVAHDGKLIRVGGMQPRNKPGEEANNHSLSACARFDPATRQWEPLPDLPEGRSSHDAVVVGDLLVVVGGWKMGGQGTKPVWHATTLLLDLKSGARAWRAVPQPFQRRALTAAVHDGKVCVLAGMGADAELQRTVNVYDPVKNVWTTGLEIPGPRSHGFSPAACAAGGRLYVSTSDGKVHRLTARGDAWEEVGQLKQPRFVHRLVADEAGVLIAVGGASKGGNVALTEAVTP